MRNGDGSGSSDGLLVRRSGAEHRRPSSQPRRREVTIRSQRQAELEPEPAALAVHGLEVAAEQRRVLGGDREAEPAAATVARRVHLRETLEDPLQPIVRYARAAVRDGDDDLLAPVVELDLDVGVRRRARGRCRGGCRGSARTGADRSRSITASGGSDEARLRRARGDDGPMSLARSTGSTATSSASASKRDTSMSSSTSDRSRPTSPRAARPRAGVSGGSSSRCSRTIDASATSAASGVRSSCATSATNRRFWSWATSSRRIVSASASAIRLNRSAHVPNSSCEVTGRAPRGRHARSARRPTGGLDGREHASRDDSGRQQRQDQEQDRADEERDRGADRPRLDADDVVHEVDRQPATRRQPADDERWPARDVQPGVGELAIADPLRGRRAAVVTGDRSGCRSTSRSRRRRGR